MHNRLNAIALMKKQVSYSKLIEGWIEGPCAEGADLRGINTLMTDFYDEPEFVHQLFEFVVEMELKFAEAQLAMGADIIGIGDAAASLVGPKIYNDFVWQYEKKLVDGIHALGGLVRLHICGDTRPLLEGMGELGCEIVDLDYITPVSEGRDKMGPSQVISGNIDPVRTLKDGTPESVYEAVAECHKQAGNRFIVAAGCEVPKDTPPENLHAMLAYAKEHTP
jgi:MtaA/CmuA family methyltransferase